MAKSKVNAKIENGKVILSDEILSILESWKTSDEKVELVEKYKRILLDSSNLNAPKFRQHHIIPTFMFKNENHKNRKETEPLANAIEGNKIKLSVYNHIIVHDIIRHIFPNNLDAKLAVYLSCRKVNIKNFTEKKIEEIAQILQDCSKTNKTDEEKKEYLKKYNKNYRNENKENLSIYGKNWRKENKEKEKEWRKNYNEKNKEKISKQKKKYREEHKIEIARWEEINRESRLEYKRNYNHEHKDEIAQKKKEKYLQNRDSIIKNNHLNCLDPKKKDICTLVALKTRICRNKELYKDINPKDCIIQ